MLLHFAVAFILLAGTAIFCSPSLAEDTIRLQLKWRHQFQFAGYYAAKELGFYREAGLDVEILEANPGTHSADVVLSGGAEYGVGNSGLLLSRNAGHPVVVLAVIFQHSAFSLISRQGEDIQSIHDLRDKRVMMDPLADELVAYLQSEGVSLNKLAYVDYDYNIEKFMNGSVDAMSSYTTNEIYQLNRAGIKYNAFSPRSVGIDFYGDNLFTTEDEVKTHPERVRAFRAASLKGWQYAMTHQDEIANLILDKYSRNNEREFLRFEAEQMQKLMYPELIDVGYMMEGRWRHIAETYARLGVLPEDFPLEGFLYQETPEKDYFLFYVVSAVSLFVLSMVLYVTYRFFRLNNQLSRLLHVKSRFSNIGESVNNISHQWKQPLNELGIQLMLIEQALLDPPGLAAKAGAIQAITEKSHALLEFMANTIDTFGHLLSTNTSIETRNLCFSPKESINGILRLVRDGFEAHGITVEYAARHDAQLFGDPRELAHVILNILNNARYVSIKRGIVSPRIEMVSDVVQGRFCITIQDNAGGVHVKPVEDIFRLGMSEKSTDDSGVGLYIARRIIEERFAGTVGAENSESGALFTITIPLHELRCSGMARGEARLH